MQDINADDDDVDLILEEDEDLDNTRAHRRANANPWRILIVDDDVDVHVVTKFALSNVEFQGRRLSYLHAYSAKEALAAMRAAAATAPIALVLLDVVMDSPDAGLRVVRQIREELGNSLVRIVLRTGQAGPHGVARQESALLLDYDINDFWSKADLTRRKLVTTVITSLRTYGTLAAAHAERQALSAQVQRLTELRHALDGHLALLVLDRHGLVTDASAGLCRLLAVERPALVGRLVSSLTVLAPVSPALRDITAIMAHSDCWSGMVALRTPHGDSGTEFACAVQAVRATDGRQGGYVVLGPVLGLVPGPVLGPVLGPVPGPTTGPQLGSGPGPAPGPVPMVEPGPVITA